MQSLKLLVLSLLMGLLALLVLVKQPATAAPTDVSVHLISSVAQNNGVTLEKKAFTDTVPLGQVVTYTVTIKNGGNGTINPTLTDTLPKPPEGLGLQPASITTTLGTAQPDGNMVKWSGTLAPGEEAQISYAAMPSLISQAGRTIDNVAVLTFGETTLEAKATITTLGAERGFWCGLLAPCILVDFTSVILVYVDSVLANVGLPYAFGFAIILFTLAIRALTYPLNMQQIKSSKAMQELQPKMKEIQDKYKNDREKLAQEQMRLYKEAGVNPLGGCLPMLVQMPIWVALYVSLTQLSHEGLLNEGFFWIPSLAGPTAIAGCNGAGGILPPWLSPFPFGVPCIGWLQALAYLVLPVLLVVSQYYMQQMMTPPNPDPQQASMNSMMKIMPVMFGYFSLIVPSGLTLYWFTSNILALIQQYFTQGGLRPVAVTAGKPISAPVSASPVTTSPEEVKQNTTDVKTKRKSRRKR